MTVHGCEVSSLSLHWVVKHSVLFKCKHAFVKKTDGDIDLMTVNNFMEPCMIEECRVFRRQQKRLFSVVCFYSASKTEIGNFNAHHLLLGYRSTGVPMYEDASRSAKDNSNRLV